MNTSYCHVALPRPDYHNRPGTLLLRSDRSKYGRCTLVSKWDQNREGYPKDYDFNVAPIRNLKISSYRTLGTHTDGTKTGETCYQTTYTDGVFKPPNKHGYYRPMVNRDSYKSIDLDRDLGLPKYGYGALLPRHKEDKFKINLITNYMDEYVPYYDYTPLPDKPPVTPDLSPLYRKCKSQFTDPDNYARQGWNTWHDESGFYFNSHFKRQLFKSSDPITKTNYECLPPIRQKADICKAE